MTRGRKREVIFEKTKKTSIDLYTRNLFLTPPPFFEPFRKNHFTVFLEGNDEKIESHKICGYKIEDFSDHSTISITSILMVGDWVDQFKRMTIVKIFFLDAVGNPCSLFDFDIMYDGFSMEGGYKMDDVLTSTFKYKILE
jgi:hypothetical protein